MEGIASASAIEIENGRMSNEVDNTLVFQENLVAHIRQNVERLEIIKSILVKKFASLSIESSISQDLVPFLHIWKPISKSSGVQGMPFLPCFHIIATLNMQDDSYGELKDAHRIGKDKVLFQLHSFHGKVLKEDVVDFESSSEATNFMLVEKMAKDKIQLCHGVEEIDCDMFKEFVKSCKLPLLSKVRSVFLIEQFMGSVVFRSRLCDFALVSDTADSDGNQIRCEECGLLQDSENSETKPNSKHPSSSQNVFEKVYYKTSVLDMEAMAVLHEVRQMYEYPLANGSGKMKTKKKMRESRMQQDTSNTKMRQNIDMKYEPLEKITKALVNHPNPETISIVSSESISMEKGMDVDIPVELVNKNHVGKIQPIKEENCSDAEIDPTSDHNALIDGSEDIDDSLCHSMEDAEDDNYLLQNSLKKKRGRPRKYHSRSEYLTKHENRKDSKKKKESMSCSAAEAFNETCQICLYKFKNESCHRKDQERHEQALSDLTQPVFCPLCNQHISTKYLLTSHFEISHSEQNLTCCCECLELIPKGNNRLRQHILKTHHTAAISLVCPDCGLKCAGNVQFQIHMAIKHSSEKSYICQHCGIGFAHSKRLQVHLRRNHQPRDLQCPHCDKKFETRDQAIRHLVVHTGLKPYKCVQCQYSSYRQCNVMSVHFLKSHGRKGSQSDVLTDIAERDMMSEIAVAEVDEMLKNRKLKLKKEAKANNDSS